MDDFDRMYETNEARFYAQHYLNQSRDAVSDASGSVRVEDVMAGSASMEDYQPVEEQPKITEDMLQFDGEFVQAAKDVYFMFEDKEFLGTPEEAAKYGIDLMGEFNYNFAGPVGFSGQPGMIAQLGEIMADASPAQANSWLYLMGRYDQLPISKAGTWRFIRGVLSDPTTYLGIGTGGVGIAARAGTKEAAKRTGIAAIKDRIAALSQKAVENPAKSGAIAGAALTAPETAGVQEVKEIAGYEQTPEERALELVTNVGIGAAAGAGLAKGVDELAKGVGKLIQEGR